MTTADALSSDETLLLLKIAFLVLLYGFILFVARSATKDLGGAPQESIVLGAAEASRLRAEHGLRPVSLAVVTSPELGTGTTVEVAVPTVIGRDGSSGIRLTADEFASARHARIDVRPDGAWVEDLGSTNGTFVNEERIAAPRRLDPGDVLRVGATELRVES